MKKGNLSLNKIIKDFFSVLGAVVSVVTIASLVLWCFWLWCKNWYFPVLGMIWEAIKNPSILLFNFLMYSFIPGVIIMLFWLVTLPFKKKQ